MTASLKALKNDSRLQSQNKWSEVDGMESTERRELRHPPSANTSYLATLYNVEGLEQDVHEPIIVPGMVDMQSQDNWEMVDSGFKFLWTRA